MCVVLLYWVFFFKQKTAYEMSISDWSSDVCSSDLKAQQVFGGHGYIVENGMEQFVRDARIAMIYEGANGVQAMDLVGRKLPKDGGRAVRAFFALVSAEVAEAKNVPALAEFAGRLEQQTGEMKQG